MTPEQLLLIAQAKRKRAEAEAATSGTAPAQPAQPAQRMDAQSSRSVLLENGIDPARVNDWYNGAENRDGTGAQIPSWKTAPAADPTKPTPPPALWEAPVNVAKAVDTPDEARARALVGRRIDGVGPRTPDPTQAPISEQQLSSQTYWNAEKPPEPMNNLVKRAAIGVTNILSDTGNMIMEGAEAIQAPRTYDPKDPMSRRMQGAPPPPVKPGPRIPMIYKPEAQNFEQAAADVTGIIGGLALPLGPVSNTFRAGGQALRSTNTIGRAAAAITPQGTSALDRTIRLGGRTAAMAPEAAATAFGAGAILGGENMGGDGDRLQSGVEFASDPINYIAQPAAMLLNRAGIFIKTAGQRVTPEVVQVQRASEVLRRANATAAEQAAAARVIDELTPPDPQAGPQQAPAQPTAQTAAQPSVAPVVPSNVAQGAPRTAQAGPAGAGQQAGAGAAQPVLNATQVAPPVGPPGYTVTMAKSDAKIIGRILRDAGIPRNDVKPLLADTVTAYQRFVTQAHQSGEKVRLNLTFFAEDYLGQRLSTELAKNVQVKLRAFGNAANNSGDLAKAPVQRAAEELRGSQETYLTDIFERELGNESLRTTKNKIRGDKQLNAQAVYKTELTKGQKVIKEGKGTETQNKAFDKLLGKMRQDEFFAKIPYELKVKAGNDPDVNGDLSEYVIDNPLEAAHWLQSNLGVLARKGGENAGAYREMRMALLRPLEDAVPGYRGARKRAGDLVGQEIAVNFGDDLFRKGRTEVDTAEMADDFNRVSPAQKIVAERSIRDKLKNEFRASREDAIDPVTGERVDSRGAMLTNLQKAGTLDALEQILGAKGKRIADAIRNIMRENPRIPSYGSDSAKNIAERRAIEDAMRSPVNKAIGAAGDKTGWVVPIVADAAMGTFPLATGARIGGEILERFGQPSRKQIASAANTLYALPPSPPTRPGAPPPPASGNRRPPPPRTGPRPPVTEADIEALRRQYDALDHGKAPKTSEQLARRIVNAEKKLAAQLASPSAPKPRRVKAATPAAAPTTAPTTPAKAKPPLPGQTSSSPPMVGGAALGALTSGGATYAATGDEEQALKAGILGGIGGGVVGSRFGKGAKPKAPAAKAPGAWKRDPATVGLGTQDYLAYINAKHPPATPNQTPPYFIAASTLKRAGGDRQAAAAELADYAAYLRKNKAAPEVVENADRAARAVSDVDPMFFSDDTFNARMRSEITAGGEAAVAPARGAADALPGERRPSSGPPGVKPPPVRNGMPGGSRDLPMDEGSRMERARSMGFDVDTPLYHGTTHNFDEFSGAGGNIENHHGSAAYFSTSPDDIARNYATQSGPDLTNRIERRAEQIQQELEDAVSDGVDRAVLRKYGVTEGQVTARTNSGLPKVEALSRDLARKEVAGGNEGASIPAYARVRNPVITNGGTNPSGLRSQQARAVPLAKPTRWDFETVWDDAGEEIVSEGGPAADLVASVERHLSDIGADTDNIVSKLWDEISGNEGIDADAFERIMRSEAADVIDYESSPGQIIQQVYRDLGHDGIILKNAEREFKNMGINPNTDHYVIFDPKNIRGKFAKFDPSQEQSSKLLAGMSGNSRGIADNLKQDAALAAFGSAGGSFANQDDPQDGALGGMGIALGAKYGGRAVNAMRGAGRVKPPPVRGAAQGKFRGPNNQTFAGVNAKTADKVALARAQNMESEGAGRDAIWDETGWFKGVDGKWRFEIDDSGASVKRGVTDKYLTMKPGDVTRKPLGEVMDHPELYEAYPDLAARNTYVGRLSRGAFGEYDYAKDNFGMYSSDPSMIRSGLLHEAGGHGVQAREGFAAGGSPENMLMDELKAINDEMSKLARQMDVLQKNKYYSGRPPKEVDAEVAALKQQYDDLMDRRSAEISPAAQRDAYNRLAGEAEARNVQTRDAMRTRGEKPGRPWETQDVPDDRQLIRFRAEGGKAESRPKPPPKGPPGTVSRMVAGGAVGGLAGSLGGDANAQEDLTAEMNSTKKDIDDLNAALKTWDSLDVMGKQRLLIQLGRVQSTYVDKNGARRKFDDGTTGDRTEPLFKAYAQEKRDALEKAEAGLEALKKQNAYRQFQKEQNPFFDAVRELGPSGAMVLAGAAATVLRFRGVGKSKAAVKVIEKDINDLLTNGPVKSLLKKGGAANTERNRAVNMNEFYRRGGAPDDKLPFNYGAAGYKPNPKAAKPGALYKPETTTKMDGAGSQFLRSTDIKVLGVGVLDSAAIMPFVSGAEEELKKAKEDVENGNESIEALRRVEKAKTDLAMYQTIQRIGWGLAGAGALGVAHRYKLPKPDIRGAEEEVAAIGGYLRSIAPPKTPRAPKALAPPATPQPPPVAGPPAQLLLPAPPPLKKPKPKPKPKKP